MTFSFQKGKKKTLTQLDNRASSYIDKSTFTIEEKRLAKKTPERKTEHT